jgi:hypothetical protein
MPLDGHCVCVCFFHGNTQVLESRAVSFAPRVSMLFMISVCRFLIAGIGMAAEVVFWRLAAQPPLYMIFDDSTKCTGTLVVTVHCTRVLVLYCCVWLAHEESQLDCS